MRGIVNKLPEHQSWRGMIQRCTNPNANGYVDYGGRGITVCIEWRNFERFFADMGEKPTEFHTLERKENDKGYYKDNCKWASRREQALNKRTNVIVKYKGENRVVSDVCRELGIDKRLPLKRLKRGWSEERIFDPPRW